MLKSRTLGGSFLDNQAGPKRNYMCHHDRHTGEEGTVCPQRQVGGIWPQTNDGLKPQEAGPGPKPTLTEVLTERARSPADTLISDRWGTER